MIELILFAVGGIGLLSAFMALSISRKARSVPDTSVVNAVGQMTRLEGLSFPNAARLVDDTEYQLLCSNPYLQDVAKRFRKDRQDLAILWITTLLSDLKTLWRFRRFLIRQGAPATFREELKILQTFVLSVILLNSLKIMIWAWGPFALSHAARRSARLVASMSDAAASVLGRIPAAGWAELERTWTGSMA